MRIITEELIRKRCSVEETAEAYQIYHLPFIKQFISISKVTNVLEVGCGEGGGLLSFAEKGCNVVGVEEDPRVIRQAKEYFKLKNIRVKIFSIHDFVQNPPVRTFDLIIVNNTIEKISDKRELVNRLISVLSPDGILFISFHPWNMPFSGCRYYCRNKLLTYIPYLHLLPEKFYYFILSTVFKEEEETVRKLLRIKKCAPTIKEFREILLECKCSVRGERYYLLDPLYKVKFKYWLNKLFPSKTYEKLPLGSLVKARCSYIVARDNYHVKVI